MRAGSSVLTGITGRTGFFSSRVQVAKFRLTAGVGIFAVSRPQMTALQYFPNSALHSFSLSDPNFQMPGVSANRPIAIRFSNCNFRYPIVT
jgi:hypothetical protein